MTRTGGGIARGVLPALLCLTQGAFASAAEPRSTPMPVNLGGSLRFAASANSMAERRFASVIRQQMDFSCGSAALATLLRYHHAQNTDERATFVDMWNAGDQSAIRKLGFSMLDMKRHLARRGFTADGYRVTLAQIAASGQPGIALIDFRGYHHFVVVKAVTRDAVLIGDPALGLRWERRKRFERQWNGIFFVVKDGDKATFRSQAQRDTALTPRFNLQGAVTPLDLAGLRIVRPVQGGI